MHPKYTIPIQKIEKIVYICKLILVYQCAFEFDIVRPSFSKSTVNLVKPLLISYLANPQPRIVLPLRHEHVSSPLDLHHRLACPPKLPHHRLGWR